MRRLFSSFGLLSLAAALSAGSARADFVENFDSAVPDRANVGPGPLSTYFNVTSGLVDVVGPGFNGQLYSGQGFGEIIDLAGTAPGATTTGVLTSIVQGPGTYRVTVTVGNNTQNPPGVSPGINGVNVTFGGQAVGSTSYAVGANDVRVLTSIITLTTTGSVVISSQQATDIDYSNVLILSASVISVPEPASMALMGTGLVGLVGAGLRRRRAAV